MAKLRHSKLRAKNGSTLKLLMTMLLMLISVLLMLLASRIFSIAIRPDYSAPNHLTTSYRRVAVQRDGDRLRKRGKQWAQILSWEPRAFLYHNFLSKEECEHMINLAKPHMERSTVIDNETGRSVNSSERTSSGMFLVRGEDEIIRGIEKRIADLTFIPVENGGRLQILHYEVGQKYVPHTDYFPDPMNLINGGQRTATLLMYLSDVEEGGETVFPAARVNTSAALPWGNELSECGKMGLSVKPKMGNALLFWSTRPDATVDPLSWHGSCPVIRGNKWSATKWIHLQKFNGA